MIIAAGHCCLDIIPTFAPDAAGGLTPGALLEVGAAVMAPGGSVSNVGLTLHRLGAPVRLLGKVGDDPFGRLLLDLYAQVDPTLAGGMLIGPGETTSYSVVINQSGSDRIFLHCPGANHTLSAAEIVDVLATPDLANVTIFHFGYPPLMRRMYHQEGAEVIQLFQAMKQRGIFTSLDMARPDPASEAGRADWRAILSRTLPFVDLFAPSLDELLFMLDRPRFERLREQYSDGRLLEGVDGALLADLGDQLIAWGALMVAVKLGEQGLYFQTAKDSVRWETPAAINHPTLANPAWRGRRVLAPCFQVDVIGATGAGDATIAGFLMGLSQGSGPEQTLRDAVAVGACSVERVDATSGVPGWETVQQRHAAVWARRATRLALPGWEWDAASAFWRAPDDQAGASGLVR
ncbi:MAG TPA: carbohydrate kinase family protein [Ktedonobacterales bacterium]|nr:carbohydrate kinase family protein [Ktedonobacterales bacterium]